MLTEAESWIAENLSLWQKICRVRGNSFDNEEELMEMHWFLLRKARRRNGFEIIFTLFMTEYEKELPFLGDPETEDM